jgi:hypothetical protein
MGCCPGRIGLTSPVQPCAPDLGVSPVRGIRRRGHFRDHAWCIGARGPVPARSTAGRQRPPRRPPGPAPGRAMTPRDEHDPAPSDRAAGRARPNFPTARGCGGVPELPAPVTEIWDWQLRGACRGLDGGVFFPPDHERGPARAAGGSRPDDCAEPARSWILGRSPTSSSSRIGNASRSGGSVSRSRDRLRGRWLLVEQHLEVGEELVGAKPGSHEPRRRSRG